MLRSLFIGFVILAAGCAGGGGGGGHHAEHVAPAPSAPAAVEGESMGGGGEASGPDHQPEVVHSGKSFRLGYSEANTRYAKGERCGGENAPDQGLGAPDQRNERSEER